MVKLLSLLQYVYNFKKLRTMKVNKENICLHYSFVME